MAGTFDGRISPLSFTCKSTGQKILFLGVDDKEKVKSLKLPFGYVGIVWIEELDQFTGMEEVRSLLQSLLRGGERYWVFCSFNPPRVATTGSMKKCVSTAKIASYINRRISVCRAAGSASSSS